MNLNRNYVRSSVFDSYLRLSWAVTMTEETNSVTRYRNVIEIDGMKSKWQHWVKYLTASIAEEYLANVHENCITYTSDNHVRDRRGYAFSRCVSLITYLYTATESEVLAKTFELRSKLSAVPQSRTFNIMTRSNWFLFVHSSLCLSEAYIFRRKRCTVVWTSFLCYLIEKWPNGYLYLYLSSNSSYVFVAFLIVVLILLLQNTNSISSSSYLQLYFSDLIYSFACVIVLKSAFHTRFYSIFLLFFECQFGSCKCDA